MQILGQCLKLSSCQLLLILFSLNSLYFAVLFQFFSKLLILFLQLFEFLLSHIEVVLYFTDIEASEDFLDECGLLVVEGQTFSIEVFSAFCFILFTGIV